MNCDKCHEPFDQIYLHIDVEGQLFAISSHLCRTHMIEGICSPAFLESIARIQKEYRDSDGTRDIP